MKRDLVDELADLQEMVLAQQILIGILAKHAQAHNPDFKAEVMAAFEKRHDVKREPLSKVDFEVMKLLDFH